MCLGHRHRSHLHLRSFQRIVPAFPVKPVNAKTKTDFAREVLPVQVAFVAIKIPPASFEIFGTAIVSVIVVSVFCGEWEVVVIGQGIVSIP